MDIVDYLITHIAPLPWTVKGTGFVLMLILAFRAFGQFLSLRWIRAATSIVLILVVALVMARFGQDIAAFVAGSPQTPTSANTQG
ncbi:MAG: hypothetical protein AAF478_05575 [Pseudomonadota bacterium]